MYLIDLQKKKCVMHISAISFNNKPYVLFTDSFLLVINVRILYGCLRRMGVAYGSLLPSFPPLGYASSRWADVRSRGYCATGLLLLCHRYEHCSAYIALCICWGKSNAPRKCSIIGVYIRLRHVISHWANIQSIFFSFPVRALAMI